MKASFPSEGVVVAGNYGGILADAPHPNAAKIWTDFLFSQKGQEILVRLEAIGSLRADVEVPPDVQPFVTAPRTVQAVTVAEARPPVVKLSQSRAAFRGNSAPEGDHK